MMDYEIQKSTALQDGQLVDKYDVCVGGEWTEESLTLAELAELRDFITEYIERETSVNYEQGR